MSPDEECARCYFVDVGQGASQVLYLGYGKAIVIDGGPGESVGVVMSLLLQRHEVKTIVALIVTHNDADHAVGACKVLSHYQEQVEALYYLVDRPRLPDLFLRAKDVDKKRAALKLGPLLQRRLEVRKGDPDSGVVYEDSARQLVLDVVYPDFQSNVGAGTRPNSTCGVLRLTCGDRKVIFSGDAPVRAWDWMVKQEYIEPRTVCDVLTVPHHGGKVGTKKQLEAFYGQTVLPRYAVISVGSDNTNEHPNAEVVRALVKATGARVLCTQLTPRCCEPPEQVYPPGVVDPDAYSLSHPSRSGRRCVACAGTVVARIGPDLLEIEQRFLEDHQAGVDRLPTRRRGHEGPLCRV